MLGVADSSNADVDHQVLCGMATCYVSAVRSLSTQPAAAVK
jgi:hypothetical protein